LIQKGKLDRFVENGRRKNSLWKSPKKKRSSEGSESPPRKTWSTTEKEQTDADIDSGAEKEANKIFLRAIMGRFSTSDDTPRRTTKTARKRPLLGFTNNEKVNGVSNEELPLIIVMEI